MNRNTDPNYPVADGFLRNVQLRCNLEFRALAMQRFEAMRRSGAFRTKAWCVPESNSIAIPADDAYEYGFPVVPGSVIWGFTFVNNNPDANPGPFSFTVIESCTDQPLFSEVIRSDNFQGTATEDDAALNQIQQLLTRPIVIPEPGQLTAQICSQQSTAASGIQLVLWGGEPVARSVIGG
jgi:hypothetical protein